MLVSKTRFVHDFDPSKPLVSLSPLETLRCLEFGKTRSGKVVTLNIEDTKSWTFTDHSDAYHLIWTRKMELMKLGQDFVLSHEIMMIMEFYDAAQSFHMARSDKGIEDEPQMASG